MCIVYMYTLCIYTYIIPVSLIDEMPSGEEISLQVSVEHVLHDGVDGLLVRAHSQQPHDVLHNYDGFVKRSP